MFPNIALERIAIRPYIKFLNLVSEVTNGSLIGRYFSKSQWHLEFPGNAYSDLVVP